MGEEAKSAAALSERNNMAAKKKTAKKTGSTTKVAKKTGNPKPEKTTTPKARKPRSEQPTSGQSGKPLDLAKADLNAKETAIVAALASDANPAPINALAAQCFANEGTKGNSWVRNSLRRLVRGGWVEKVGTGTYRLTDTGRARNEGADTETSAQASQPA